MIRFEETAYRPEAGIRFGRLYLDEEEYYDVPALAPLPTKTYDVDIISRLKSDGVKMPIIVTPLRFRDSIKGMSATASIFAEENKIGEILGQRRTLLLPDVESETFSVNVTARDFYNEDKLIPDQVKNLLFSTGLTYYENEYTGKKNYEYLKKWEEFRRDYGLSSLRNYEEKIQSELGSPIFFAPTPLIRVANNSLDKAFQYGTEMLLTTQKQTFKGLGIHLLLHSEIFGQDDVASELRAGLINKVNSLKSHSNVGFSSFPFISIKVYDPNDNLLKNSQASLYRKNFSSTVVSISENVREMNGFLIIHNMGRWSLGGVDSGADLVSFRSDGKPFEIDNFYHRKKKTANLKDRTKIRIEPKTLRKDSFAPPFDPEKLSDGEILSFKSSWNKNKYFKHPPHVQPQPWWAFSNKNDRWKYRARVIIDSIMELDREIREMAKSEIPVYESVRSRIGRMGEQDPMVDLCPSYWYRN